VRLLLDTHVLIWAVDDTSKLSPAADAELRNPVNELVVSAATPWEIAIKLSVSKLTLSLPFRDWMTKALTDLPAALLPIHVEHCDAQIALPGHHRDPFDRLLIAQAMVENIPVVSADAAFDPYPIRRIW
jgi:PIN domain nuclease of toxin-antitoxin system